MFSEDYMPAASETFSHVLAVSKYYICPAPANDLVLLKEFQDITELCSGWTCDGAKQKDA